MTNQNDFTTKAIKALFDIHKGGIPKRSHEILASIDNAEPGLGLDTKPVKAVLKNMDDLIAGDMIVLAGPIGCGKSMASHIGAMVFLSEKYLRPLYDQIMEKPANKDLESVKEACFAQAVQIYASHPDRPKPPFEIVRAFDMIPDSFKEGHLKKITKDPRLLIIDDLGREHFTDRGYGISIWDEAFDGWYSNQVPRIINTNMTPDEFKIKYNRRIHDRLRQCARWVNLKGKSLRKQN